MGLYTGQRKEALLSLRWAQVDLEAGRINFNPPRRRQTNKRRPHVPIAPRLLPHLHRARRRGTDLGFVINRDGGRLGDIKKGFAAACARAGLEGVSPHTLRHTAATWLMQGGVAIWQASGFLGMTPETLEKVYGHHHPDYLKDAASQNVRATPAILRPSGARFEAVHKGLQVHGSGDEFSEGRGHRFESCRVRHRASKPLKLQNC
jgi:integrase